MSGILQESIRSKNESDLSMASDEESFVVLDNSLSSEPVDPDISNQAIASLPLHPSFTSGIHKSLTGKKLLDGQMPSNSSMQLSMDLSPEEIQIKLNEVLQENIELKETLYQNNLAMKQQLTTLRTWQEEVSKSHRNHKEKFAETKDLIMRLKTENEQLKNAAKEYETESVSAPAAVSASDTALVNANAELVSTNAELTTQVNILQKQVVALNARNDMSSKKEQELISLTEQLNRQLELVERSRRQMTHDNERLQAQKTRLEREVVTLKADFESQKQKAVEMERETNNVQTMHAQERLDSDANLKELAALKMQIQTQQNIIEELTKQQQVPMSSANGRNIIQESHLQEKKLEESNTETENQNERFLSLNSWLQVASENVNKFETSDLGDSQLVLNLQAEMNAMKKVLADEQAQNQEKTKQLSEAQQQFQNLFSDYQSVLQDLEDLNKKPNPGTLERQNMTYYEVQVRGFTEKIDNMTAKIMNLEDSLAQKVQKIAELSETIRTLEAENETIAVLQIQMQVYQADFNAEREARESLAGEKERLAEDLRHLQRRNQQLLNELKLAQQNHGDQLPSHIANGWNTISTPGRNHARENTPPSPGPNEF